MVLLFDQEPAEALEDVVMCSGYGSATLQRSECVRVTEGVGGPDRLVLQRGDRFVN